MLCAVGVVLLVPRLQDALARWRGRMMSVDGRGKAVLGVFILTGFDRQIGAFALDHRPDRAIEWSTAV